MIFLLALALPLLAAAPATNASAWTMFRADARLSGRAQGELPADPKPLWTFRAQKGISSTAAIANGMAYVGALDGNLYALDLATGKLRWKYVAGAEIKSSPSVAGGVVYFGDSKGVFHAVDAKTGAKRWTFKAEGEIISSANFTPDCVLFGSYDQFLYCIKEGKTVWKVETDGYVHAMPAVDGDRIISAGCDGWLRVLRASDGKELRRVQLGGYTGASPAVADGRAYVGTFENQFLAVDLASGAVAWTYEHPVRKFPYYASAALGDGFVAVGGRDKLVRALDMKTGRELWAWSARAAVDASPVLLGDRVFAADKSGRIFALDARTGKPVWTFDAGAGIDASPAIAEGRLVISTSEGTVYAFGAKKG